MSIPLPSAEERELRRTIRDTEAIQEALFQSIMDRAEDAPNPFDCVTMLRLALDAGDACRPIIEAAAAIDTHRGAITRLRALSGLLSGVCSQIREAATAETIKATAAALITMLRSGEVIRELENLVLGTPDLRPVPIRITFNG